MRSRWMPAALAALAVAAGGCGSSGTSSSASGSGSASASKPNLTVSAALACDSGFTHASSTIPSTAGTLKVRWTEVGLTPGRTINYKVSAEVTAVYACIEKPGVTIAIGSATVPIGAYTRKVLAKVGGSASKILANVRSEEPDVSGIVGKLTQGAVDAGLTYVTDVRATHGALRAITLPASLQPVVAYGAAIVKGGPHPAQAQAFINGLISGTGKTDLLQSGFLPPPAA